MTLKVADSQGFTYISVLILVVVMSIALTGVSRYWSTIVKRERETEILYRGDQIRRAIESYHKSASDGKAPAYPRRLEDLLKDPRYPVVRKHLRKLYSDPMAEDGKWGLILDVGGNVKGVFSKSEEKPLKVGDFPSEYEQFETAQKYSDWKFVYEPQPTGKKG